MIVLPTSYFPPIHYFIEMINGKYVIDIHENFIKQTYRNRCEILGANGILALIVPLEKTSSRIIKDKKISYTENWQKNHQKSLQSAYQRSPYYEYYEDTLISIFNTKHKFLVDLNNQTLDICLSILKLDLAKNTSTHYQKTEEKKDKRILFSPKNKPNYTLTKYSQVFEDRFEFQKNISIFDLICNLGPQAVNYILKNQLNINK